MLERLVENWLDSAGERTYQRCFCQMLTGQGYRIVHNTQHTPLEFGKDVIAISPTGALVAYQLKGNPGATLKPREFDGIRGQLEQLATLALTIPEVEGRVPDECYLVTNGEIDEAVYHQIQLLNRALARRGHANDKIKTITRGKLLDWSKSLGQSLWPSEIEDFGNLVKLLNYEGNEIFPAKIFDPLLRNTLCFHKAVKVDEMRRRVTSAAIMTSLALHSFSRRRNHYAEITAWMMFVSYAIAACEKNNVSFARNCREAVLVARDGIYDLLGLICTELINRKTLAEGDVFSDFEFYRPRALLIYALMSTYWIWSEAEGWKQPDHKAVIDNFIPENLPRPWLWGEGAIPHFLTYIWYRKRVDATAKQDKLIAAVLGILIQNKLTGNPPLASPYYDIEKVVRHRARPVLGCDDPFEGDSFEGTSYFCESLLVCLVRANLKQDCKDLWADFTKVHHERVLPEKAWQFGLYRTGEAATNETIIYEPTMEWSDLQEISREHAALDVPKALKADPILLLLFVNIFPFRASFSAMKFLHQRFDGTWFL